MSPNKRYRLDEIIERERSESPSIEIETAGGRVFEVPGPSLWPDAVFEAAKREDVVTGARLLLGDDYDAFCEAGGTAAILFTIIGDSQGSTLPES